jgi:putative ATP-dependent endonuclease of the OLD family
MVRAIPDRTLAGQIKRGKGMQLLEVEVTNFRNFRKVIIRPRQTNVLIGENGAGKSNFLHAMRLVLDPNARQLQAVLSKDDINVDAVSKGEICFRVRIRVNLTGHEDLRAVFLESIAEVDGVQFVDVEGCYQAADGGLEWGTVVLPPPASKAKAQRFTPRMAGMLPMLFLDPVRDAAREARVGRGTLLERLMSVVDVSPVEQKLRRAMNSADKALLSAPDVAGLRNSLQSISKALLPGGQARVGLSLSGPDATSLVRTIQVVLGARRGEPSVPLLRHGTGFQNLVLIAMYRHLRDNQTGCYPILAVEEPEAHLHPHAQRRLMSELIQLDGTSFVTTHSPTIAAATDPRNIIRVHASHASAASSFQLEDGRLSDDDASDFRTLVRNGRSEALFARAVIVVEGASEAIALPAFAALLGLDLDRDGVSILDASGNACGYVLRTLGSAGLNVPLVVTFDCDAFAHNDNLLRTALSGGYLTKEQVRELSTKTTADKRKALKAAGWIPVVDDFEAEVCRCGYLPTVVDAIKREGGERDLASYLAAKGLPQDVHGVSRYVVERKRLKVPVAVAVSEAAQIVRRVPPCFKKALSTAVRLAVT